jgi:hypothetical protein
MECQSTDVGAVVTRTRRGAAHPSNPRPVLHTQVGDQWYVTNMYLQPNEGFDKRYLVFRPVSVSLSRQGDEPQVGVMLTRWYSNQKHDHWTSVQAVPGNYTDYKLEAQLGYLMYVYADQQPRTQPLYRCFSQDEHSHFAATSQNCANLGKNEGLLPTFRTLTSQNCRM